jgi:DNA-binding Xre family transcriptional regulator
MTYRWLLREQMAERGLWKTTDLAPLLAERGIHLSAAQIYRLVAHTPERMSLDVLAALCDIFDCEPGDLIAVEVVEPGRARKASGEQLGDVVKLRRTSRPRRARVDPDSG